VAAVVVGLHKTVGLALVAAVVVALIPKRRTSR